MKGLMVLVLFSFPLIASGCAQTERGHGRISSNTVWQGRVILEGDVYVAPGARLTVLPGTLIRYSSGEIRSEIQRIRSHAGRTYDLFSESRVEIIVAGDIDIGGTESNPVIITAPVDDPERAGGINFIGEKCGSQISHLIINGGYIGIRVYDFRKPLIENVSIKGTTAGGIGCWDAAAPVIRGSVVERTKYGIGAADNSGPVISRSLVRNNSASGVFFEGMSSGEVTECEITGNNVGVAVGNGASPRVHNSVITGNGSGVGCWNESTPEMSGNNFYSNIVGVLAVDSASPVISSNTFRSNGAGASFGDRASGLVRDNSFTGSGPGIVITGSSSPELDGNSVAENEYGIRVEGRSAPSLVRNTFRSNRVGMLVTDFAKPRSDRNKFEGNETDSVDSRLNR